MSRSITRRGQIAVIALHELVRELGWQPTDLASSILCGKAEDMYYGGKRQAFYSAQFRRLDTGHELAVGIEIVIWQSELETCHIRLFQMPDVKPLKRWLYDAARQCLRSGSVIPDEPYVDLAREIHSLRPLSQARTDLLLSGH